MPSQRRSHRLTELLRLLGHHPYGLLERLPDRIVASRPRVVERGLVGAKIHRNILVRESLPEIHDVAHIGQRDGLLGLHRLADAWDQFVQVLVKLIDPALVVTLAGGQRIDLGGDANDPGDVSGLRLRTRHSAQTGGHEEHSLHILPCPRDASGFQLFAGGVHHGDGRSVYDSLRADVHIRSGCHLAVL